LLITTVILGILFVVVDRVAVHFAESEAADEPTTAEAGAEAEEAPKPKKKTRRGSRGGRNRKKKAPAASQNGAEPAVEAQEAEARQEEPSSGDGGDGEFDYVPMSEWADELESGS